MEIRGILCWEMGRGSGASTSADDMGELRGSRPGAEELGGASARGGTAVARWAEDGESHPAVSVVSRNGVLDTEE